MHHVGFYPVYCVIHWLVRVYPNLFLFLQPDLQSEFQYCTIKVYQNMMVWKLNRSVCYIMFLSEFMLICGRSRWLIRGGSRVSPISRNAQSDIRQTKVPSEIRYEDWFPNAEDCPAGFVEFACQYAWMLACKQCERRNWIGISPNSRTSIFKIEWNWAISRIF